MMRKALIFLGFVLINVIELYLFYLLCAFLIREFGGLGGISIPYFFVGYLRVLAFSLDILDGIDKGRFHLTV